MFREKAGIKFDITNVLFADGDDGPENGIFIQRGCKTAIYHCEGHHISQT